MMRPPPYILTYICISKKQGKRNGVDGNRRVINIAQESPGMDVGWLVYAKSVFNQPPHLSEKWVISLLSTSLRYDRRTDLETRNKPSKLLYDICIISFLWGGKLQTRRPRVSSSTMQQHTHAHTYTRDLKLTFKQMKGTHLSGLQHEPIARIDLLLRVRVHEVRATGRALDARHRGVVSLLDAHASPYL